MLKTQRRREIQKPAVFIPGVTMLFQTHPSVLITNFEIHWHPKASAAALAFHLEDAPVWLRAPPREREGLLWAEGEEGFVTLLSPDRGSAVRFGPLPPERVQELFALVSLSLVVLGPRETGVVWPVWREGSP